MMDQILIRLGLDKGHFERDLKNVAGGVKGLFKTMQAFTPAVLFVGMERLISMWTSIASAAKEAAKDTSASWGDTFSQMEKDGKRFTSDLAFGLGAMASAVAVPFRMLGAVMTNGTSLKDAWRIANDIGAEERVKRQQKEKQEREKKAAEEAKETARKMAELERERAETERERLRIEKERLQAMEDAARLARDIYNTERDRDRAVNDLEGARRAPAEATLEEIANASPFNAFSYGQTMRARRAMWLKGQAQNALYGGRGDIADKILAEREGLMKQIFSLPSGERDPLQALREGLEKQLLQLEELNRKAAQEGLRMQPTNSI